MQVTVKVGASFEDPVGRIRQSLDTVCPRLSPRARVEELFPGLRSGNRAGMVIVHLPDDTPSADVERLVQALRAQADVAYAELERPRTSR